MDIRKQPPYAHRVTHTHTHTNTHTHTHGVPWSPRRRTSGVTQQFHCVFLAGLGTSIFTLGSRKKRTGTRPVTGPPTCDFGGRLKSQGPCSAKPLHGCGETGKPSQDAAPFIIHDRSGTGGGCCVAVACGGLCSARRAVASLCARTRRQQAGPLPRHRRRVPTVRAARDGTSSV